MKLRLYAIRDVSTNTLVPDLFFSNKPEAKRGRDKLNLDHKSKTRFVTTFGPDHHKRSGQIRSSS